MPAQPHARQPCGRWQEHSVTPGVHILAKSTVMGKETGPTPSPTWGPRRDSSSPDSGPVLPVRMALPLQLQLLPRALCTRRERFYLMGQQECGLNAGARAVESQVVASQKHCTVTQGTETDTAPVSPHKGGWVRLSQVSAPDVVSLYH